MTDDVRSPHDSEVDLYGMTHVGKVRENNEDNFLICSFRKMIDVHFTSLPDTTRLEKEGERLGFLAIVADGVGGSDLGEIASRRSLELLASFASTGIQTYFANDPRKEELFIEQLRAAVMETHATILSEAQRADSRMKTTLTMVMTRWPVGYVVQVGDSRCYLLREGELRQLTRDQTLAQYIVDAGVKDPETVSAAWGHVLASSVGGKDITPVITKFDVHWDDMFLLCTDGLTAHVTDEMIRAILTSTGSAQEACEALVDEALEGGGTDNVTVVIGSPRLIDEDDAFMVTAQGDRL